MDLKQFAEEEAERLEAENQKFREAQNLPGFWIPKKGENKVEILPNAPREKDFGQGNRKIFRVKTENNEEKDWALNPKNPVYKAIIHKIREGKTKLNILRTGEGQGTRYEILESKEA